MNQETKSAEINAILGIAHQHADDGLLDVTGRAAEDLVDGLRKLVLALESGLLIVAGHHYGNPPAPEPFPGAVGAVVAQCLAGIELARKTKLVPER